MKRLQRCQKPFSGGGPPLCNKPGTWSLSIAFPAKPSIAGRSVSAAMRTISTAAMHPVASPIMYGWPMRKSPKRLMTTVQPAKRTERPAVIEAVTTASRGSRPSKMPWRYRVTMKSA